MKTIVREFKWTAQEIDELFVDDMDYHGIIFWYNDLKEVLKEINKKK